MVLPDGSITSVQSDVSETWTSVCEKALNVNKNCDNELVNPDVDEIKISIFNYFISDEALVYTVNNIKNRKATGVNDILFEVMSNRAARTLLFDLSYIGYSNGHVLGL